ncbi:dihydrolipoamide succinyltransferase component of 2-oxoglutarate dehydrogenase complex protein [Sulfuricella denitrificans skB26]|uniref:Dihydrolipoyllysine-residue succinyltransferase component of 2-oxoglutarate dehydrogenase complex n=1 Tax=Sulfuricella denitrificans (strain DSM 22764 / NBRC 105220 / skB26) TaxID=1163617 RepID=S6AL30_SULDS|nr:2-oxoglutarate dehydrogenase complex dihydrolipoyllysine-residue succinyltransferase [Sulfuricella denitrificans]BAN35324.1 dihydrolipoamide succinyltransferase component of 2-oxoglutarate dehydrogenase complex protein [Sulfuricella denitrificans skB26]
MLVEVKIPVLSESISEATLLSWHKKVGDSVVRDEILIDVETDKVVLELPAPQSGILAKIIKGDGLSVTGNEVIAVIDTEANTSPELTAVLSPEKTPNSALSLSPAVRKLVTEHHLNPVEIRGSGQGERITKEDVLAHLEKSVNPVTHAEPANIPSVATAIPAGSRPEQRVPMTRLRARIAERLVEAQQTAAILTTFNEANMQPVMELRNRYKEKFEKEHGVKLGFMSFFVKAVIAALKKYPIVNASIDGDDIVYHGYYDIGIAVGSPRGLVVPILRDADQLSIAEIEKKIADFGVRAKDGKLTIEELTGGTFTISNGGVFGSMMSTPILNPPQSAILGMHKTTDRPVAENGQIVIRPMMYLALSYDHRVIDGREAVLSLVAIKEALEDPARMLLQI